MRRRGIMFVDAVIGLGLVSLIAMVLLLAKAGVHRLDEALADRRAATRMAELRLLDLNRPAASTDAGVRVNDLNVAAPTGWKWVSVDAIKNGRHGELVGLVRSNP
ncbi:MAG: hypothetical protein ACTHM6_16135 [Tepidisphaeraceae bacterium]